MKLFKLSYYSSRARSYLKEQPSDNPFDYLSKEGKSNDPMGNERDSAEGKSISIPFIDALKTIVPPITACRQQYFFPSHNGGKHLPTSFTDLQNSNSNLWQYDVPELDGLDNIHNPQGPLLEALELATGLFGAKRTWFLVNGSTSGILIAILSCIKICRTILPTRVNLKSENVSFV